MSPSVGRNLSSIRCLKSSIVCWVMAALLEYRRMVAYIATSCRGLFLVLHSRPASGRLRKQKPAEQDLAQPVSRLAPRRARATITLRAASWLLRDYHSTTVPEPVNPKFSTILDLGPFLLILRAPTVRPSDRLTGSPCDMDRSERLKLGSAGVP